MLWSVMLLVLGVSFINICDAYVELSGKTNFPSHKVLKPGKEKMNPQQKLDAWKKQNIDESTNHMYDQKNLYQNKLIEHEIGNIINDSYKNKFGKTISIEGIDMINNLALESMCHALDNDTVHWVDPQNHLTVGKLKLEQTLFDTNNNLVCRDFSHIIKTNDEEDCITSRACRSINDKIDMAWRLATSNQTDKKFSEDED